MATELDNTLDTIMDGLVAPGGPAETVPFTRNGVAMPAFKNAPPSLAHYFAHYCDQHKDTEFLVDDGCRLTFGEAYDAARHVAAGLLSRHKLVKGDRIGIAARNSANWIVAYMGITMAGGCAALVNGFSSGEEMADALKMVGCRVVLADRKRAERLEGTDHGAKVVPLKHDCNPAEGLAAGWGAGGVGGAGAAVGRSSRARKSGLPPASADGTAASGFFAPACSPRLGNTPFGVNSTMRSNSISSAARLSGAS